MPHECCPARVGELSVEAEQVESRLAAHRDLLRNRKALQVLTGEYITVGDMEREIMDGEQRLKDIDREQRDLLQRSCICCRHHCDCPASLV